MTRKEFYLNLGALIFILFADVVVIWDCFFKILGMDPVSRALTIALLAPINLIFFMRWLRGEIISTH